MASTAEKLPPSIRSNRHAVTLANTIDRHKAQISKLRETADRPGRAQRAMVTAGGAAVTGGILGLMPAAQPGETTTTRDGVTAGVIAAIGIGAGLMMDSDIAFDMGVGAGNVAVYLATRGGVSSARARLIEAAEQAQTQGAG